jgi:very-short-patch-repair endonuclease
MPRAVHVSTEYPTEGATPPLDQRIGGLADRQHGVVALAQLAALGLSSSAVRDRVAAGRLRRLYRGVFVFGHIALRPEGRVLAAVLACGPGAVASHRAAADVLGLLRSARARVDVTSPGRAPRRRKGIDVHGSRTLAPADITTANGIPCTSVARTLLDLAEVVDRRSLERACEQAEVLRMFDRSKVEQVLERTQGRKGAALLAAVLTDHHALETPTRSELEAKFLRLCEQASVPRPRVNEKIQGLEVDFHWPAERLIVETDGYATHGTRRAFEGDRARDRKLTRAGWRVVRFTWRQLERDDAVNALAALANGVRSPAASADRRANAGTAR